MPDTMIERVAQVLIARCERIGEDRLRETARVVVEAMREPTDAMAEAAYLASADGEIEMSADAWAVMIDAALAEGN